MARRKHTYPASEKKRATSIKKYIGRGLLLGTVLFLVYVFLFGDYGAYRIWKQKKEIARLQQTIEVLRLRQEELMKQIDLLQSDLEYIEKIAREEYGLVKEGEIIYKLVPSSEGESNSKPEKKDESSDEERS